MAREGERVAGNEVGEVGEGCFLLECRGCGKGFKI